LIMMESVDAAAGQLADTTINGQDRQDISSVEVAEKRDENGSGSSGKVEQVEREEEEEVNEVEDDSEKLAEVPERRTEVRQMGLPVGSSAVTVKKDIATVTSPVEIKQIKIGDPKIKSQALFRSGHCSCHRVGWEETCRLHSHYEAKRSRCSSS